jgi:DNA-binding SARP family transcriptional activator/tetratricopeptide (TPR) repeat protein
MVLAALAVNAGQLVPTETLIDRVWPEQPPAQARRNMQAHITRIRRLLEQASVADERPVHLVRRAGGYLLDVEADRVDLHRYRHLVNQARDPGHDDAERVALLRAALGLWHGEPLAGLGGPWVTQTRQDWRKQHRYAVVDWARAELRAGDPATVIGPLTELVGEDPYDVPPVEMLMRALHATRHTADALALFRTTRERLVTDLGVEPREELQQIFRAILRNNLGPPPAPVSQPTPIVPKLLPRNAGGFTGRWEELAQLDAILAKARGQESAVVIGALSGTAGVGKTTLAGCWGHRVADRFPDGQLYVDLRGFDIGRPVLDPAAAARGFLDALKVPTEGIPADPDALLELYRRQLAGRRMLVVLDNARDTPQVRPLLPHAPGCLVLVTSRNLLTGLVARDGAQSVILGLLPAEQARELLVDRLGPARVAAEPDAVEDIVMHCVRLPLALAIVAAHAATHPQDSLRTLADELHDAGGRLDRLTTDDPSTDVRTVLSWSYRALTPGAMRLFRLLGLHPGPDITAPAAASLAGLPLSQVRPLLAELTEASLLMEQTPGRYLAHDLLRAYAIEQAHTTETREQRRAATHRMLDHYLHTGYAAARCLDPHSDPITLTPPQQGLTLDSFTGSDQALAWFAAEHAVLLAALDHAASGRWDVHTWQLAWTMATYLYRQGHGHDLASTQHAAAVAARRLADHSAETRARRNLSGAYSILGRFEDAHTELMRVLELCREAGNQEAGNQLEQAHVHRNLANIWEQRGNPGKALDHARQALARYEAAGDRGGQADALNTVGWCHALLGNHKRALTACDQALLLHQEFGDSYGQANTWDSLGYAHHHLGRHDHAVGCYRNALDLYRRIGERLSEANTLARLGEAYVAAGNTHAAGHVWQQALTIFDELNQPDVNRMRTRLASLQDLPDNRSAQM